MAASPPKTASLELDTVDIDTNLLTISKVLDADDVSIINRITYSASFKVGGINAEPNKDVWITNDTNTVKFGEGKSNASGEWETSLMPATVFDCYSIVARGQYGVIPASLPKKFTVATKKPIINLVSSEGIPIKDGDTVYGTSLTIEGTSVPARPAEAFDDETSLGFDATPNNCGKFTLELTELEAKTYKLRIKAPEDQFSETFTFTMAAEVALALVDVLDAKDASIPEGGDTFDTTLKVKGKATPLKGIQLQNKGTPIEGANADTDETGDWELSLEVTEGNYQLTAMALYGNGEVTDPPRSFNVRAIAQVTLDKVTDLLGVEVPQNSTTTKTSFFVEGKGQSGLKLEIFNGATPLAEATVDSDGSYKHQIGPLGVASYTLTGIAKYENGGESAPYPFEVIVNKAPWDTKVQDNDSQWIEDGGETKSSYVVVRGFTEPLGSVRIKVNGVVYEKSEPANDAGAWAGVVKDLEVGTSYTVSAVAADDDSAESNTVTFTRIAPAGSN